MSKKDKDDKLRLGKDLEEVTEEEYKKDIEDFKKDFSEENLNEIAKHVGVAHDVAYESFKKKFEELSGKKGGAGLAKEGEEISDKHLNDLLESYLTEFVKKSHKKDGEAFVENIKKTKFKDENERSQLIDKLAMKAGLYGSREDPGVYHLIKATLKKNKKRHYTVLQDFINDIEGKPGILSHAKANHHNLLWKGTLGKQKYDSRSDLVLEALNELSEGKYKIVEDEDKKSRFHGKTMHEFKGDLIRKASDKNYTIHKDKLKEVDLEVKEANYK